MVELVKFIAQSLVEKPEAVDVREVVEDEKITIELRVDPDDMGKVIGRHGKIAKEIRVLMRAVAQKQGKKVSVDILD